jgi:hypothetical protein
MKRAVLARTSCGLLGCMQIREEIVVMPTARAAHAGLRDQGQGRGGEVHRERADVRRPDEIQDKIRGLVALSKPSDGSQGRRDPLRLVGWFEDLNALRFMDDGEGEKAKASRRSRSAARARCSSSN